MIIIISQSIAVIYI